MDTVIITHVMFETMGGFAVAAWAMVGLLKLIKLYDDVQKLKDQHPIKNAK